MTRMGYSESVKREVLSSYYMCGPRETSRVFNVSAVTIYKWLDEAGRVSVMAPSPRPRKVPVYQRAEEEARRQGFDLEERSLQNMVFSFASELRHLGKKGSWRLFPLGVLKRLRRLGIVSGNESLELTDEGKRILKELGL